MNEYSFIKRYCTSLFTILTKTAQHYFGLMMLSGYNVWSIRAIHKEYTKDMGKSHKNKEDKYHLILNAAIKVFAEQGFYNSTISQIAREAGVADGTIYLYFKNKQDILVQFFTYKAKQVFDKFRKEVSKESNSVDKLRCLIRRHFEEFQKDRNMAVVYRAETRQSNHMMEEKIKEMSKTYLDIIAGIIEQGQEEGTLRQDLYMGIVKRFILGAVEEVINVWVVSGGKYDLVSQADPLVDLFLNGIGDNSSEK